MIIQVIDSNQRTTRPEMLSIPFGRNEGSYYQEHQYRMIYVNSTQWSFHFFHRSSVSDVSLQVDFCNPGLLGMSELLRIARRALGLFMPCIRRLRGVSAHLRDSNSAGACS